MKEYLSLDGTRYEAETTQDLVHQMNEANYSLPKKSDEVFMREMMDRVGLTYGERCEYSNADEFIACLIKVGHLKEIRRKK